MTALLSQDRNLLEPTRAESTLRDAATRVVRRYLVDLNGTECNDLHALMMRQVEKPVLEEALRFCAGNLTRTAHILGITRATLRKKMDDYGIGQ